jgi:hypothetical protein
MAESDNILTKLHDLLLYVVPVLAKFPRDHKFTLGDRILLRLLDVQECCVMAYYGREKAGPLTEAPGRRRLARASVTRARRRLRAQADLYRAGQLAKDSLIQCWAS